jgi:hypothetical protein
MARRPVLVAAALLVAATAAGTSVLLGDDDRSGLSPAPSPVTTTSTSTPPRTDIRGEAATASVEPRLLRDPDVLWVGTWEDTDWPGRHGAGAFRDVDNTTIGDFDIDGAGRSLRARTAKGRRQGFGYHASFDRAGIGAQDDVHYRYRVYFPDDYVWRNRSGGGGGKLPGLAGKAAGGDEEKVGAGGQRWNGRVEVGRGNLGDADGWSARVLWNKDRTVATYLYAQWPLGPRSRRSWFGHSQTCRADPHDQESEKLELSPGAWNTIELRVRMNTPGQRDGILQLWLNGRPCVDRSDVAYRSASHPDLRITEQYVTWFYGGPARDAPDRDSTIYFDDAVLSRAYVGPRRN